jgi:hypothetical protein
MDTFSEGKVKIRPFLTKNPQKVPLEVAGGTKGGSQIQDFFKIYPIVKFLER